MRYKYIIYKIYSWTSGKKGDTPIANTILTLAVVHYLQMLTIFFFINKIVVPLTWLRNVPKTLFIIGMPLYSLLLYLILYNKKRWEGYVEEYSSETEEERKRGNRIVRAFLIGSILLFFISLPLFSAIAKHMGK